MSEFASLAADLRHSLGALDRPRRVPVSQGAAESLILSDAGGYSGPWSPEMVPYLKKPMDLLASRHHESVCFVGPARTGKTAGLILGWIAHALTNDLGRMMVMHMTEQKAEELSKLDVEPAIESSPKLRALRSPYGHDNNIKLKIFKHGMAIKFAYPTPSHLAGGTYRYVALTDYDRFPSPRGAGEIFDNAHKRTETAMSRRMTLVESSPEREIEDPHWTALTPHEAPPVGGILGIYNRGDKQRWYWPCPHCGDFFQASPGLGLFASLPDEDELMEVILSASIPRLAREHAVVFCPHCGAGIESKHKHLMNTRGEWLLDGQEIDKDGCKTEIDEPPSHIASFWLGGVSAAYQSWEGIIRQYLYGLQQYARDGSEEALRKSTYTDLAMPYTPRALLNGAARGDISEHAEDLERYIVPDEARFVTIAADVQGGQDSRFVIQAHAHAPDHEQWVIDRRDIRDSKRPGSRDSGYAQLDPARYPEDWEVLTDLLSSTYRTGEEGQELMVAEIIVDSGGEEGVTENAYAWWKSLSPDLRRRAHLYKGGSVKTAAPVKESRVSPGQGRARGADVPILVCNPNPLKDAVFNGVAREGDGAGKIHLPTWLGAFFWDEMRAEVRKPDGTYERVKKRNEAVDLCAMTRALVLHMESRRRNRLNWENPPPWARGLHENAGRMSSEERRAMRSDVATGMKRRASTWL